MRAHVTRAAEGFDRGSFTVAEILRMQDASFISEDIFPRGLKLEAVMGSDMLLAIEVAATSVAYDRGLKARLYARHSVNELWVIDAERCRTLVHSSPAPAGRRTIVKRSQDEALTSAPPAGFSAQLSPM